MQDLIALVEKHLGGSWLDVIDRLRDLNELDDIEERIRSHDYEGAIQGVQDAAEKYAADIHAGYVHAGQTTAKWLDGQVDEIVRFDVSNDRATKWAKENTATLRDGWSQEMRETVNQVVSTGVQESRNPREIARDLRTSIGLTPSQAAAVDSYRKALESGDFSNALGRELSDGRSDRSVASAQRRGVALDPAQIDGMVERYRQNYVGYRAETIARTESLRAVHAGNEELMQQAIDGGDVDAAQLTRTWNHAGRGKDSRPGHIAMADKPKAFGEPFVNPVTGESLDYPGDPDADPSETVCCRCCLSTRFAA